MKFSDIRKTRIQEDCDGGQNYSTASSQLPYNDNSVDSIDASVFDIAKPGSIQRLNAFLSTFSNKRFIDPNYALKRIQNKLGIVGLHFSFPPTRPYKYRYLNTNPSIPATTGINITDNEVEVSIDTEKFPLSYLGGRYGVLDDKYTVGHDDGISHRVGKPLTLQVSYYLSNNGLVSITAKIM